MLSNEKIEQAYNETFAGLTLYYRDCDLKEELIDNYQLGQIILEPGFTDVSSYAEGLGKNFRYAIASNDAADMSQFNPAVEKWGFHLINAGAYFKVLDIYKLEDKTQILLLHFSEQNMEAFKTVKSNMEDQVIEKARKSLDTKIKLETSAELYAAEWLKRTREPLGMNGEGEFFLK